MKFLSFSQPWLWSILYAGKRIENRSWKPPIADIGTRFALHAAQSWDDDAIPFFERFGLTYPPRFDQYPRGMIVGTAVIDRVVTDTKWLENNAPDQIRWFFGPCGWVLSDVRVILDPVPMKGARGLRRLEDDIASQLVERNPGVA